MVCLDDYKVVKEMETVNAAGDVKKIYRLVNSISNKTVRPITNLTTDKHGQLLQSPKSVLQVEVWKELLSNKFKATEEESRRPPMEYLPKTFDPIDRKEFERLAKKLNLGKTTGPDGMPTVVLWYLKHVQ